MSSFGISAAATVQTSGGDEAVASFINAVNSGQTLATTARGNITSAGTVTKSLESTAKFTATAADFKDLDAVTAALKSAEDLLKNLATEYPQLAKDQLLIHTTWTRIAALNLDYYRKRYPTLQAALGSYHVVYGDLGDARTKFLTYYTPTPAAAKPAAPPAKTDKTATPDPTGLSKSETTAIAHVAAFLTNLQTSLKNLGNEATANGDDVLVDDQGALTPLENVPKLRIQFQTDYNSIKALTGLAKSIGPIATADTNLQGAATGLLGKIAGWSQAEDQDAKQYVVIDKTLLEQLIADPAKHGIDAATEAKVRQAYIDQLAVTAKTEAALVTDLQDPSLATWAPTDWSGTKITSTWAHIAADSTELSVLLAELGVSHDDNITSWTQDQIQLYYFDDVARLIQFLNPDSAKQTINDATAQLTELTARAALDAAGQNVVNKQADVANARNNLATAQEAQRQAQIQFQTQQTALNAANLQNVSSLKKSQDALNRANARLQLENTLVSNAQAVYNNAQSDYTAQTATPKDPTQRDAALNRLNAENARQAAALTNQQAAQAAYDSAKDQQTAIENTATQQLADAKAQVAAAQTALDGAQQAESSSNSALATSLTNMFIAGAAETRDFAKARDSGPFWVAAPTPPFLSQTDPVKRVMLFGSPDSRTIFIRGRQADIDRVKEMVQKLDRPEAQAEMTLYTVQINSTADRGGVKAAQEAEKIVQDELEIERAGTTAATDLLTEKLNAAVETAVTATSGATPAAGSPEAEQKAVRDRGNKTSKQIIDFFGWDTLEELGLQYQDFANALPIDFVQVVLPRPVNTGTLGEALVAISLTSKERRKSIVDEFESSATGQNLTPEQRLSANRSLKTELQSALNAIPGLSLESRAALAKQLAAFPDGSFTNLRRIVGTRGDGPEIMSLRQDIIGQLRLRLPDTLTTRIDQRLLSVQAQLNDLKDLNARLQSLIKAQGRWDTAAASELWRTQGEESASIQTQVNRLRAEATLRARLTGTAPMPSEAILQAINEAAASVRSSTQVTALKASIEGLGFDLLVTQVPPAAAPAAAALQPMASRANALAAQSTVQSLVMSLGNLFETAAQGPAYVRPADWYDQYHAQLARANETLNRLMHGIDQDMKANFVHPMVERLGNRLLASKIAVGVFQKTSILASNRLIAQVDPQASAEFAGKNDNPLQDLVNFMSLFGGAVKGSAGPPATSTGALASALMPGTQAANGVLGGVQGFTSAAANLPTAPPPAVYGITSGNTFTVTPVFDPTGQALRFRLDFFSSTQIRESDNTVSPALPRIERHSVNTEVRLSNFETADVSEFLVNSRLGQPSQKIGGIPFLKDIYPLSELPVIGWFARQRLQAAEVQQSLILTQTSMYPTIEDIIELLTSSSADLAPAGN